MTRPVAVVLLTCITGGCMTDRGPLSPDLPQCYFAPVNTGDWERVTETRSCGLFCSQQISYLVPPTFERAGSFSWERNATRTEWFSTSDGVPVTQPYPEMQLTGACQATISGHRAYIDYGQVGDLLADQVILAFWRSVEIGGTRGDLLFAGRMKDAADMRVLEAMIASVQITQGRND